MAKKNTEGRLVIPAEIVQRCTFLRTPVAFGVNANNQVFVGTDFDISNSNCSFLGNCDYDEKTSSILIPENVDIALGKGNEYYFTEKNHNLYIYKNGYTFNPSKLLSYPVKFLDDFSDWIKKRG